MCVLVLVHVKSQPPRLDFSKQKTKNKTFYLHFHSQRSQPKLVSVTLTLHENHETLPSNRRLILGSCQLSGIYVPELRGDTAFQERPKNRPLQALRPLHRLHALHRRQENASHCVTAASMEHWPSLPAPPRPSLLAPPVELGKLTTTPLTTTARVIHFRRWRGKGWRGCMRSSRTLQILRVSALSSSGRCGAGLPC